MVFSRVIAVTLLMTNIAAYASGLSSGGKVVHVSTVGDAVIFNIEGNTESNRPSCATSGRFAAHKDSVHVPVILAAFTTEKELANVGGTGACTNWSNAEDVQYVEVCQLPDVARRLPQPISLAYHETTMSTGLVRVLRQVLTVTSWSGKIKLPTLNPVTVSARGSQTRTKICSVCC